MAAHKKTEAQARIKINRLLEEAGWRFFKSKAGEANISLEHRTEKRKYDFVELGNDFEQAAHGFMDYLLLDNNRVPVALVEAKRESIDPLTAKEQAREYARGKNIRHIFLSNGNYHYYWDLLEGNPVPVSKFMTLEQLGKAEEWKPAPHNMSRQQVDENYIAVSQDPNWLNYPAAEREIVKANKDIRILRDYQLDAIFKIRNRYVEGERRFLLEMATGTGKTLLSAAVIKMFYRSDNAKRILFLVDRLELERQAYKNFADYLKNDAIRTVIYKEARDSWQEAAVVVTTIQTLANNDHYCQAFNPSDFQLIISDEAHRTISGNNRAIFEYFIGAKLGLTATPKDYLKGIKADKTDPRVLERRALLDTYRTFGCENGIPTFRFSLEDAVRHKPPYLCSPKLLDIRTDITTEMLSKDGWTHKFTTEEGDEEEDTYFKRDFMRRFFSSETNRSFVRCFLENAKRDPVSGEIGKTIFFCVSRHHCTLMTKMLNEEAALLFPRQYGAGSDFAVQITSDISGAQDRSTDFANDKLNGYSVFEPKLPEYDSSRTRVCVTVGMMTTGYDCPNLLNVVLARPIFSPTDYIQIKGRGTRLWRFENPTATNKPKTTSAEKDNFFLFDFFANHEFFEDEFDYSTPILLREAVQNLKTGLADQVRDDSGSLYYTGHDEVQTVQEEVFDAERIMRVDREAFSKKFEETAKEEAREQGLDVKKAIEKEDWEALRRFIETRVFDKPQEFWNMEKIQELYETDRRISWQELLKKIFLPDYQIKTSRQLADEYFKRFCAQADLPENALSEARKLFYAYLMHSDIRAVFDTQNLGLLAADMRLSIADLGKLGRENIDKVLHFIKDNIPLNEFLPK